MRELNEIIKELVEIEMDSGCHLDYVEDYESELEYYLSNVKEDAYVDHYLEVFLSVEELEKYDLRDIQEAVIEGIEEKME